MNTSLKSIYWVHFGAGLLALSCALFYLFHFGTQLSPSTQDFAQASEESKVRTSPAPSELPRFAGLFVHKLFHSSCQPRGAEFLEQDLLFSEDGSIAMTDRIYSQPDCQGPSTREIQRRGHYHLAEEENSKLLLSVRSITVETVKITAQSIEQAQTWNQQQRCGLNNWENQKTQSVNGCDDLQIDRGSYYEALAQLKGNTLALEHSPSSSWIYQAKLLSSN